MEKCFSIYGIGNKYTEKLLESLVRFIRILMQLPGMTANLVLMTEPNENVEKIRRIIEHGRKRDAVYSLLKQSFEDAFLLFQHSKSWRSGKRLHKVGSFPVG